MAVVNKYRLAVLTAACLALSACGGTAPTADTAAAPQAGPAETAPAPAPAANNIVSVPASTTPAATTHACMIAGEFVLMGTTIRSRDCVQTAANSTEADLRRLCEGLAQTSAQMGGKAGEVTYMDSCPSPSQGSCTKVFGGGFDGYYYERTPEDLANLPASCAHGGGTWNAG